MTRPASRIELGIGGVSDGNFASGNYTGLDKPGGFLIGNVDLRGRQYSYGNSEDDRTRWRITGSNLGLSIRNLTAEYGRQGAYRITFGYDQLPRFLSDSFQTPFMNAGVASLALPAGFVRAPDTATMSSLAAAMHRHLEAVVAATPQQWVDAIARLYEDADAWRAQQQAAWAFTASEFGVARGQALMQAALEAVEIFATPDASCLAHDTRPV